MEKQLSPFPLLQFEMTAGGSKIVTVKSLLLRLLLDSLTEIPQGCLGQLRFKGLWWKTMSDPHLPVGNICTQNLKLAGGRRSNLAGGKERCKTHSAESALLWQPDVLHLKTRGQACRPYHSYLERNGKGTRKRLNN